MWNYGKSPSSGLYPEIGRRAKQGEPCVIIGISTARE
jgi:hypothetical protein